METRARGGDWDLEEGEEKRLMLQQVGEVRLIAVSMPPSVKRTVHVGKKVKKCRNYKECSPQYSQQMISSMMKEGLI